MQNALLRGGAGSLTPWCQPKRSPLELCSLLLDCVLCRETSEEGGGKEEETLRDEYFIEEKNNINRQQKHQREL